MPSKKGEGNSSGAGHSDTDPGAVGNGHTEADIVLAFRDAVCDELEGKVTFDRDGQKGQNLPLRKAVQQASSHDVAVEFHCNAKHIFIEQTCSK